MVGERGLGLWVGERCERVRLEAVQLEESPVQEAEEHVGVWVGVQEGDGAGLGPVGVPLLL